MVTTTETELNSLITEAPGTEAQWKAADTPTKRKKFLDRVKLSQAMQTIDAMAPVTAKDKFYDDLHGQFRGSIRFLSKERKNGKISIVMRRASDIDPPNPKAWTVRIDVDNGMGKVTRQTGGFDMLRTISNQSAAFAVRSSEASYLQMFYQESADEFVGNYYEKNSNGEYPRRGSFVLKRPQG